MTSPAVGGGGDGGERQTGFMQRWMSVSPLAVPPADRACPGVLTLPLLSLSAPNSTSGPAEESWWSGLVIVIAVCCASLVFLTVLVIICYKAIKR